MKNIYLLSTEKGTGSLAKSPNSSYYIVNNHNRAISDHIDYHIYITNDDYIKDKEYGIYNDSKLVEILSQDRYEYRIHSKNNLLGYTPINTCKKIIMTTDPKLIEKGVQSIPDIFLEWFVKNTTSEYVEIGNQSIKSFETGHFEDFYKIIIPKEELKQVTLEEVKDLNYWKNNAEEDYLLVPISVLRYISELEKQQERSYSEEDMFDCWKASHTGGLNNESLKVHFKQWFEQFKKK